MFRAEGGSQEVQPDGIIPSPGLQAIQILYIAVILQSLDVSTY